MIVIDTTLQSITAVMSEAVTTTNPDFVTGFLDGPKQGGARPGSTDGALNGTTAVELVPTIGTGGAPRQVDFINIYNRDTVAHTITIRYLNDASTRIMQKVLLQAGESLMYARGQWTAFDVTGTPKVDVVSYANYLMCPPAWEANATSTELTTTDDTCYAVYLGTCPYASSSIKVLFKVITALATITSGEVAIGKGAVVINGNPTVALLGYADVSATFDSTGIKSTTVTLTTAAVPGDQLWAMFAGNATTPAGLLAGLADTIQSGGFASKAATQPSADFGSPVALTLAGATVAVPWVRAYPTAA